MISHSVSESPSFAEPLVVASDRTANELAPSACSGSQLNDDQSTTDPDTSSSPIELMVHTRARRSNAGNRMSKLIAIEEADDIGRSLYEALEDVPDDDDFSNSEAAMDADDISLESSTSGDSSDDDRRVPENEELEGEKELEREERSARRAIKRKAHDAFLNRPGLLKRTRLRDSHVKEPLPTSIITSISAQLPVTPIEQMRRKKSERVSWLGTEGSFDSSSRRLSSRSSTLKSRTETHQRLLSKERTRLITVATMKAAEERREALKQKPLTQADRLAEAARMERLNAKSLNRWEETEWKKVAERRAKLEAQRNRVIEGEFIRFWSGSSALKIVDERLSEATSSHIIIPSKVIPSTKAAERGETPGFLPLPTPKRAGNADTFLPAAVIMGQSNVAREPNPTMNFAESGRKTQPPTLNSKDISSHPVHPPSSSSTRTPTVPIKGSLTTYQKTYSTSQPPEIEITQKSLDAPKTSPAFLEGIHFWTARPNVDQHPVMSRAIEPTKPTIQTDRQSAASSNGAIISAKNITEAGIPQSQRDGKKVSAIPVTETCSSQIKTREDISPDLYKQQAVLPLTLSPFEEQSRQGRPLHQLSPDSPSAASCRASSEKRAYNLVILKNIDPAQIQNTTTRDRDREKDSVRYKLFGWPTSSIAGAGTIASKSMHKSIYKVCHKYRGRLYCGSMYYFMG